MKEIDIYKYIEFIPPSSCWFWNGPDRLGKLYPRRVVYEIEVGLIPDGKRIRMTCGTKECVNPEHMNIGFKKRSEDKIRQQKLFEWRRTNSQRLTKKATEWNRKNSERHRAAARRWYYKNKQKKEVPL